MNISTLEQTFFNLAKPRFLPKINLITFTTAARGKDEKWFE